MNVPAEYRVFLEDDEWVAIPVSTDPNFRHLSGFGTTPVEALEDLGTPMAMSIEIQLDELRKNAGGK